MTRIVSFLFCLVLVGSLSLAQNPPEQPGTGGGMGPGSQTSGEGMHGMHGMSQMHQQMMKDMQADLDSMRSKLQKMKDQIGRVSDRGTRDQLELNLAMWQALTDQMDKHMAMMKKMMSTHKGPPRDGSAHERERAPAAPKQ